MSVSFCFGLCSCSQSAVIFSNGKRTYKVDLFLINTLSFNIPISIKDVEAYNPAIVRCAKLLCVYIHKAVYTMNLLT